MIHERNRHDVIRLHILCAPELQTEGAFAALIEDAEETAGE